MDTATTRNAPCPCGSGKRYKHCHGVAAGGVDPTALLSQALAAQRAGSLDEAESLYRRVLDATPANVDALHMLAMVRLARNAPREALDLVLHALDATEWRIDAMRTNLGLVLAALSGPQPRHSAAATSPQVTSSSPASPLVSV